MLNQLFTTSAARIALVVVAIALAISPAFGQTNCPSGINLYVSSGTTMVSIWSPVSGGDYNISNGWGAGLHTGRDLYSIDLTMPLSTDRWKPLFLPFTGRIWTANNGSYGNTVMTWDPGSGQLNRLAHLQAFSSVINNSGGSWFGAGTKVGYIGETGAPGNVHVHVTEYREVKVGYDNQGRYHSEAEIINYLRQGQTPPFAQPQKFRLIAPSDNCDLVRFSDSATVYTNKSNTLYPITFDAWRSLGLSLNLTPSAGTYDQVNGALPIRVLPPSQRVWFTISSQMAWPRTESAFRGQNSSTCYVFRWGRKQPLSASQFGTPPATEFRAWEEVMVMDQNYVNQLPN